MKRLWILIIVLLSTICRAQDETDTSLIAEDNDPNTYDLIQQTFSTNNNFWAIDAPGLAHECTLHNGTEHIVREENTELKRKVFKFSIHNDEDYLGCGHDSNVQRTEIKVHAQSKTHQKATQTEIHSYNWSFRIPANFSVSTADSYLHRVRSISTNGSEKNVFTLNAKIKNGLEVLELVYQSPTTNEKQVLTEAKLDFFKGRWITVLESIKYDQTGRYQIMVLDQAVGRTLLSHENSELNTWGIDTDFMAPSWGIYRYKSSTIQDEEILYGNFYISEYQTLDEDAVFYPVEEAEEPEECMAGAIQYKTPTHADRLGPLFNNPYGGSDFDNADKTGILAWDRAVYSCSLKNEGTPGERLRIEDIRTWNKNNPCLQLNYPVRLERHAEGDGGNPERFKNPYMKKRKRFPVWQFDPCWMNREEISIWNAENSRLHIIVPELPREEMPNDALPEDDDLSENYYKPEDEDVEGEQYQTVFTHVTADQGLLDMSLLKGEIVEDIYIEEPTVDWTKNEVERDHMPRDGERDTNGHLKRSDKKKKWYDIVGIADMLKSILEIPAEIIKNGWAGYYDPAGMFIRLNERKAVEDYKKETKKTTAQFRKIGATTEIENVDRRKLIINAGTINFTPYINVCDNYLSPGSKSQCKKRVEFLERSLLTVNNVIFAYDELSPYKNEFETTTGQTEQIQEKYTTIQNKIYTELEVIRSKAEKQQFIKNLKSN